jgi:hypothetical protein
MSWLILHRWWISLATAVAIGAWWFLFLVLMPAAWKLEQRRVAEPGKDRQGEA